MDLNKFKMIAQLASEKLMLLNDEESLKNKILYLDFNQLIGKTLPINYKFIYEDKLYKTIQNNLLIQEQYKPSIDTAALYTEINEKNAGSYEDPIPYNNNMVLEEGKYYIQNEIIYKCIRSTGIAVFNNLEDLVNIYVEKV